MNTIKALGLIALASVTLSGSSIVSHAYTFAAGEIRLTTDISFTFDARLHGLWGGLNAQVDANPEHIQDHADVFHNNVSYNTANAFAHAYNSSGAWTDLILFDLPPYQDAPIRSLMATHVAGSNFYVGSDSQGQIQGESFSSAESYFEFVFPENQMGTISISVDPSYSSTIETDRRTLRVIQSMSIEITVLRNGVTPFLSDILVLDHTSTGATYAGHDLQSFGDFTFNIDPHEFYVIHTRINSYSMVSASSIPDHTFTSMLLLCATAGCMCFKHAM